jgi:hypothetical protein
MPRRSGLPPTEEHIPLDTLLEFCWWMINRAWTVCKQYLQACWQMVNQVWTMCRGCFQACRKKVDQIWTRCSITNLYIFTALSVALLCFCLSLRRKPVAAVHTKWIFDTSTPYHITTEPANFWIFFPTPNSTYDSLLGELKARGTQWPGTLDLESWSNDQIMKLAEMKGVSIPQGTNRGEILTLAYWHDLQRDLDFWSDSQIRDWVLKNGMKVSPDSERDELLNIVHQLQNAFIDGFSGIDGLPRTYNGMKVLGYGHVSLKTWSKENGLQIFPLDNVLYIPDAQQSRISVGELHGNSQIYYKGNHFESVVRFFKMTAVLKRGICSVEATIPSIEETLRFSLSGVGKEKQEFQKILREL